VSYCIAVAVPIETPIPVQGSAASIANACSFYLYIYPPQFLLLIQFPNDIACRDWNPSSAWSEGSERLQHEPSGDQNPNQSQPTLYRAVVALERRPTSFLRSSLLEGRGLRSIHETNMMHGESFGLRHP